VPLPFEMKRFCLYIFLLSCFLSFPSYSQNIDSLWTVFRNKKNPDSVRFSAFNDIAWEYLYTNPDSAFILGKEELEMARAKKLKNWESKSLNTVGASFQVRGNYTKAIEYYLESLKIREEMGDKKGVAASLANIGSIYISLDKYDKALDYELKAMRVCSESDDKAGLASTFNNLGLIYTNLGDNNKSLEYTRSSLVLYTELNDKYGMSAAYANMGEIHLRTKEYDKAVEFLTKSLEISDEEGNSTASAKTLASIASANLKQKKYPQAIEWALKAKKLARESGNLSAEKQAVGSLSTAYKATNNTKLALEYFEEFKVLEDSIKSEANQREIERKELIFEFDKKAAADSVKNAEAQKVKDAMIMAKEAQIDQDTTEKIALTGGLVLLFVGGFVLYNRFRIIKKQKLIIEAKNKETEEQKLIIEEKQKEILSSISYAKRLQEAILPPQSLLSQFLPNSFFIYKPKDIVAGDFYWLEHIDDLVLFAAADCTGHGVPGAMVSVVCSNALNRAVKEFGFTDPGKILDKTRELVAETFERSENEVKDGMDISICVLNNKTKVLQWAGANNPLWIIKDGQFTEFKPNKQPIGKVDNAKPYSTHTIQLKQGDLIYVFTDGYVDQFGGPDGKKYKHKQFGELLISHHHKLISEQKEILIESFNAWKGNLEQVDDVCVIGIKI
jgi:serine phosphatase RsbU (regulator of sigma subunit)